MFNAFNVILNILLIIKLLMFDVLIIKTSDYDLNRSDRKAKFNGYDFILCGNCNQKIDRDLFYCKYCYDNETDREEKNRMSYGRCKKCNQLCTEPDWCSTCGFQNGEINKQIVFKSSNYDLDEDERSVKFRDYSIILCEKCKQKFNRNLFICECCYSKEINREERYRMEYGKCKGCSQACTECNWCSSCGLQNNDDINKQIVFKTIDYDLNRNERKVKYKDYNLIFCADCREKFGRDLFYCKCCCSDKETNEEERNRMLYGRCKKCFRVRTKNDLCSSCGFYDNKNPNFTFLKTPDYYLDLNERRERRASFKDYDLILCEKCNQKIDNISVICDNCYVKKGCKSHSEYSSQCLPCRFKREFYKWTSDNENIDELIQESQISAHDFFSVLEWIPYDRFKDIKFIAKGGFAKVHSATWIDGYIIDWKDPNNWERYGSLKVALKVLNNSSENISEDFLNEVKSLKVFPNSIDLNIVTFYGITREPTTHNYALVFKLEDSSLRYYLNQNYNVLTWERKLCIIEHICSGLRSIHSYNLIHKDLHIGNILHSTSNNQSYTYIGDFGLCIPANEVSSKSKIYGVIPYMAPEILRGGLHTKASDIYSLGIILNEIISINPPFNEVPHDYQLVLDICRDNKRPKIREGTPEVLKILIKRCWDANPKNRPSSDEIDTLISSFRRLNMNTKEINLAITSSLSKTQLFETHSQAIYTSRPLEPQNQKGFTSSRNIRTECFDCEIID